MEVPDRFELRTPEARVPLQVPIQREAGLESSAFRAFRWQEIPLITDLDRDQPGGLLKNKTPEMIRKKREGAGYEAGASPDTRLNGQRTFRAQPRVSHFKRLRPRMRATGEKLLGVWRPPG